MTMSRTSLVDRAWLKNQSTPAAGIPHARYDAMVNQAMAVLAQQVATADLDLLQTDFSITVTSGVGSLTTSLTTTQPILLRPHPLPPIGKITSSDSTQPWQYLPDFGQLSLSRPTFGMVYYTIDGSSLIATAGTLNSLSTTATARTYFVPLPASLSGNLQLEEWGIRVLANLAAGVIDVAAPTPQAA